MSKESIGGFFVDLGMNVNGSFYDGINRIKGAENTVTKLSRTIKTALGGALLSGATKLESAELKTADAIGITTSKLSKWKTAAAIAGTSASSLTSSMQSLENKMQGLKLGEVDTGLAKKLGMLGIGYTDFANMDATQRISSVFSRASSMEDQKEAARLIQDILGNAGYEYYQYLKLSGTSLQDNLKLAERLVFTTESSKKKALSFQSEFSGLAEGLKSIGLFFGSQLAGEMTPAIKNIKLLIAGNKELIQQGITGFTSNLGVLISGITSTVKKLLPLVSKIVDKAGGLSSLIVKIGLGVTGLKIAGFATGLLGVVSSLTSIKTLLIGGLGFTLLSQGIESVTEALNGSTDWDIAKKLGGTSSIEKISTAFKNLSTALGEMIKSFTNTDSVKDGVNKITNSLNGFVTNCIVGVTGSITALTYQMSALKSFVSGDFKQAKEYWNKASDVYTANDGAVGRALLGDWLYERTLGKNQTLPIPNDTSFSSTTQEGFNKEAAERDASAPLNYNIWTGQASTKNINSINDGIVAPGGKVTSVSPHDWVFAIQDISNLAGAFTPSSNNYNNAGNISVNISQNFTIGSSASAPMIKSQVYKGTSEAISAVFSNAAYNMQIMSSTR